MVRLVWNHEYKHLCSQILEEVLAGGPVKESGSKLFQRPQGKGANPALTTFEFEKFGGIC